MRKDTCGWRGRHRSAAGESTVGLVFTLIEEAVARGEDVTVSGLGAVARGARRVAQSHPVAANGGEHGLGVGLEQVVGEVIRMLRRDGLSGKATGGELAQVGGHDHVRSATDRCGQLT